MTKPLHLSSPAKAGAQSPQRGAFSSLDPAFRREREGGQTDGSIIKSKLGELKNIPILRAGINHGDAL
jgi:hypothetical protein